jgi:hypothetical protein
MIGTGILACIAIVGLIVAQRVKLPPLQGPRSTGYRTTPRGHPRRPDDLIRDSWQPSHVPHDFPQRCPACGRNPVYRDCLDCGLALCRPCSLAHLCPALEDLSPSAEDWPNPSL